MMYSPHSALLRTVGIVLLGVASVLPARADESTVPAGPLTGRFPHSPLDTPTPQLSQPLAEPTPILLNADALKLPEIPRVASRPRPAAPQSPPREGEKAAEQSPSTAPERIELPIAGADDLAGAFATPGNPTKQPKLRITAPSKEQKTSERPKLAEPDRAPPPDEDATSLKEAEPKVASAPTIPAKPLPPLSRNQRFLRTKLRKVLAYYYTKPLNSQQHDSWEVMHGMLAYELHSKVRDGGPRSETITSIGHLCFNRPCKRQQMLRLNGDGEIEAKVGVGVQGHKGQFLAMLAQCNVTPDYPVFVDGEQLTIRDLINSEQRTCVAKSELTFKLIGLMHYLPSDATWVDNRGESWDIPRLIREELAQPIRGAACGGTHRLSGLTLAARKRIARGEPLDGDWLKAHEYVEKYQNYAYRLQNRDGSLSTEWFRGPGYEDDIDRRIKTTGHILEWLLYAADDEQLQSPQTLRAVIYLTNLLYSNSNHEWEVGPLSHALHALVVYDKRVFQPYDNLPEEATVNGNSRSSRPTARRPSRSRSR